MTISDEIKDMAPVDVLHEVIKETEIPQDITLPSNTYRVYSIDPNTARLVYSSVMTYGFSTTVTAFRLYYASRTAPKGFIKFITTGLFGKWAKWVIKLQERRDLYGTKWHIGAVADYIEMLKEDLTSEEVYQQTTKKLRETAMRTEGISEVDTLKFIQSNFNNTLTTFINKEYKEEITELLLLFPECPEQYVRMSVEYQHLNSEVVSLITELKEYALQYYMYKELA